MQFQSEKKGIASVLGLGDDQALREICEWTVFDEKMKKEEMKMPTVILEENENDLKMEEWNNIPLPVISTIKILIQCIKNLEKVYFSVTHEHKVRSELIVKKFKQHEAVQVDKEDQMKKFINKLMDRNVEILDRFKFQTTDQIQKLQEAEKKLRNNIMTDKEYYDQRFEEFTKEETMKQWTQELL